MLSRHVPLPMFLSGSYSNDDSFTFSVGACADGTDSSNVDVPRTSTAGETIRQHLRRKCDPLDLPAHASSNSSCSETACKTRHSLFAQTGENLVHTATYPIQSSYTFSHTGCPGGAFSLTGALRHCPPPLTGCARVERFR